MQLFTKLIGAVGVALALAPAVGRGQSLTFNGSSQYVTMGVAAGLNAATFTVECWFYRTGAGVTTTTGTGGIGDTGGPAANPLVTKGRSESDAPANLNCNYFLGITASGNIAADFEDAATGLNAPVYSNATVANNTWNHAAVTYDGASWNLYINGRFDKTLYIGRAAEPGSIQHAAIGSALNSTGAAAGFFQGSIDNARIWNYARTPGQIAATYGVAITAATTGLVGNYTFNDGTASNSGSATAPGTLTGGPTAGTETTYAAPASPTTGFTPGNIVVARVGNGTATLGPDAQALFLDEYSLNAAGTGLLSAPVQAVALPTVAPTAPDVNRRLVASGTATSEGALALAGNGEFLTVQGYDAALATASVKGTTSAATNRVVGRVAAGGTVNTATALSNAFSGDNIRGAVTNDGNQFWLAGATTGILLTTPLGNGTTSTTTTVSTTSTNTRVVAIYDGQLYFSTGSGSQGIYTVGTGLPTATSTTSTRIITTNSPYGFVFFDRDATVAGVDVAYVADDALGVQKYAKVSGTWTLKGTIAGTNIRGLTARLDGSTTTLVATSDNGSTSNAYVLVDTNGYNATFSSTTLPAATLSASAGTDKKVFRGVALAPGAEINVQQGAASIASGGSYAYAGTTTTGSTADAVFTIQNQAVVAVATLKLPAGTPVYLTGANADQFSIQAQPTVPTAGIAVGGSVTVTVRFAPTTAGSKAATLNIPSSDVSGGESLYTIALTGTAGAPSTPTLLLAGTLTAFNTVAGVASATQSYQLSGSNLTGAATVTAPAGFEVSRSSATAGFGGSVSFTAAELAGNQAVYVRLAAATAAGSYGGAGNAVSNVSAGANNPDAAVPGSTVVGEPTNTPSALTVAASALSSTSVTLTVGGGNGSKRLLVVRPASPASTPVAPTDQLAYAANATYGSGPGTGPLNYVVLSGSATSVTVALPAAGTATDYVAEVYAYNEGPVAGFENYNPTAGTTTFTTPGTAFGSGSVVVARVGNGSTALGSAAAPVALLEYGTGATPALRQTLALPTANGAAGTNQALTLSGNTPEEGELSLSGDGRYLTLGGYAAAVGTASVNSTAATATKRVAGRVAADGSLNTVTALGDVASGQDLRTVASADGTGFYLGFDLAEGPRYAALGASTSNQLTSAALAKTIRYLSVVDGQLYASSSFNNSVYRIGSGTPTTDGQAAPAVAASSSPYAYALLDLNPAVAGVDLLYVVNEAGTLTKASYNGTAWTVRGTTAAVFGSSPRGLVASNEPGGGVRLYATNATTLYTAVDTAAATTAPNLGSSVATLATAGTNYGFRGLAYAPAPPSIAGFAPASGPVGTSIVVSGSNFIGTAGVTVNGTAVSGFAVNSAGQLTVTVAGGTPIGAGTIAVTTATGSISSTGTFTVVAPLLTAAPSLAPAGPYCAGGSATVSYSTTGPADAGNVFTAELSDAGGSFATPTVLGTVAAPTATAIAVTFPGSVSGGSGYLLRVRASAPLSTSPATAAFVINNVRVAPAAAQALVAGATGAALLATEAGNAASGRQWYYGTAAAGPYATAIAGATGLSYVPGFATPGTYYVVVKSDFGTCQATSNAVPVTVQAAEGAVLLEDYFNYPAGQSLSGLGGWATYRDNGQTVPTTAAGNLNQPQYPRGYPQSDPASSPASGSLTLVGAGASGEDVAHALSIPAQATTTYAAATVRITAANAANGGYFLSFYNSAGSGTTFRSGKVYVRAATGGFHFGVAKNNEPAASPGGAVFDASNTVYSLNTTYLVVLKYERLPGASDDVVSLFVFDNTATPTTEPASPVATVAESSTPDEPLDGVAFWQSSSMGAGADIDALRVGTTWGAAVGRGVYGGATAVLGFPALPVHYFDLQVAGTAATDRLDLTGPVVVEGDLTLTQGKLYPTAAHTLTLLADATVTGGSDASYVAGAVLRLAPPVGAGAGTSMVFPVGAGGAYRPLTLHTDTQSSTTTYTGTVVPGAGGSNLSGGLTRVSGIRTYALTPDAQPTGYSGSVTLSFGADDYVNYPQDATLVVAKRSDSSQPWADLGHGSATGTANGGAAVAGTLTSNSFSSFSDFSLASTAPLTGNNALANTNPLPVELTRFGAVRLTSGAVRLGWGTASEHRSARFVVERSLDGRIFAAVARLAAQGESAHFVAYEALDAEAPASQLYYRLRQEDADGSARLTGVVTVAGQLRLPALYPNPARTAVQVLGIAPGETVALLNAQGQVLRQERLAATGILDLGGLPTGLYLLRTAGGAVLRLVKE